MSIKWTEKSASDYLRKNWGNYKSELSYLGIQKIYNFFGGVLTKEKIENILVTFESYSLMRQEKPSGNLGMNFSFYLYNIFEADSFLISEFVEENRGYQHILCIINTFSKRAFAVPMKNRDTDSGLKAIHTVFNILGQIPEYFISDNGGECTSKRIVKYLKSKGCTAIIARGRHKASSVEAFQRGLQRRLYSHLDNNQTRVWIDDIPQIIASYNMTVHSSTGFTPFEIEDSKDKQDIVLRKYLDRYTQIRLKKDMKKRKPKYKIGDVVRTYMKKSKFTRSYDHQTNPQRYIIYKIDNTKMYPQYFLEDELGVKLKGGAFLESEIIRVNLGQIYRQFIRKTIKKGGKEYNVIGIVGYPKNYDWIEPVSH